MNITHPVLKQINQISAVAAILSMCLSAVGQEVKKKTLAICEISPIPALDERVQRLQADKKTNKEKEDGIDLKNELDVIKQSLDGQLIDRMFNARKFSILAHNDLPAIIKGGTFSPGSMKDLPALDYVVVATIDDFGDSKNTVDNGVAFRNVRLSVVAKIYASTSSEVLETANFQLLPADLPTGGVLDDQGLVQAARKMADRIANRVTSVIYPPAVIDVDQTNKQVTINWGDGLFIATNEVWEVCSVKVKDGVPILKSVGKVKISRVDPKTSTGDILGDGSNIKEDCLLRK